MLLPLKILEIVVVANRYNRTRMARWGNRGTLHWNVFRTPIYRSVVLRQRFLLLSVQGFGILLQIRRTLKTAANGGAVRLHRASLRRVDQGAAVERKIG